MKRSGLKLAAWLFFGVTVISLAGGLAYRLRLSQGYMVRERAEWVADLPVQTQPYYSNNPNRELIEFFPLSAHELLLICKPAGSPRYSAFNPREPQPQEIRVFRIHLLTKQVERAPTLEKTLSEWPWGAFHVSPDGQWLLCVPQYMHHAGTLVNLWTGSVQDTTLAPGTLVAWFPDSDRFLALPDYGKSTEEIRGQLLRTKTPRTSTLLSLYGDQSSRTQGAPMPPGASPTSTPVFANFHVDRSPWNPPGVVTPDQRLLLTFYDPTIRPPSSQKAMATHIFSLSEQRHVPPRAIQFDPPGNLIYGDSIRLNRDGTRLLWQCRIWSDGHPDTWRLYTAGLDGADIHLLGSIPLKKPMYTPLKMAFGAEWMPDSKTVCFVANSKFYLLPDR